MGRRRRGILGGRQAWRLAGGHGQFMDGPKRLVEEVKAVLEGAGGRCSLIDGHTPRGDSRVLLLGRSFVVAEAFWFERLK
ncbi:hypothetical protein ACFL6C_09175 [Myxococcota bacterium]